MYAALDRAFAIALHLAPYFLAWIFRVHLGEFTQQFLGALIMHLGGLDHYFHNLVTALVFARVRDSFFAQAEFLAVLRALRDLEQRPAIDGGHFDLGSESGFGNCHRNLNVDVVALALEEWMWFH